MSRKTTNDHDDRQVGTALVIGNINWFRYASPQTFFPLAGAMIPWFAWAAAVLCAAGLYVGFFVAPTDH